MRTLLFSVAIALASFGCSKSESKDDKAAHAGELPDLTVDEVAAGIEAKTLTAVDCNNERTRKKHGVLPGAIVLQGDTDSYPASELPSDKATKLVFYCGGPG
jgi:hypothetical protein